MKILIIDSMKANAEALQKIVERAGFSAEILPSGADALQKLDTRNHGFKGVIVDRHLLDADGWEVVRILRQRERSGLGSALYTVALSDDSHEMEKDAALRAGADAFLSRPLDTQQLVTYLDAVRQACQNETSQNGNGSVGAMGKGGGLLGEVLVDMGLITISQLQHALQQRSQTGQMLGTTLVANGWVSEEDITRARAVQMEVAYVDASRIQPEPRLLDMMPYDEARRFNVLPLSILPGIGKEEVVQVAIANPWNIDALDAVQRRIGKRAKPCLANEKSLAATIERLYRPIEAQRQQKLMTDSLTMVLPEDSTERAAQREMVVEDTDDTTVDDAPIIKVVNAMLAEAVRQRASDIHFEPYRMDIDVRYRIDGEMVVMRTLPRRWLATLVSRIKIMAELDISERRVPQDGRIAMRIDGRDIDFRVSTLPTQYGERIVLRILDRAAANFTLDQLGFSSLNRGRFENLIRRPWGIVLVTGPTGSGKSTTLYAALNAVKAPHTNILTCEDPVEYELDRIGQSNINVRAGLTFAAQLRAILRQDPDVILVGEIRDQETAETAFRAALTGHMVLSTLHCNEAAGAPTRLMDMDLPSYLIASALTGVVAQRLVRRLCQECKEEYAPEGEEKIVLQQILGDEPLPETLYRPGPRSSECETCGGRGMRGRMGVHEIMMCDEGVQQAILHNADTAQIRTHSLAGGTVPMIRDGLQKAIAGKTTLEEVKRRLFAEGLT
ncbi:MAG: GspE/PulE family protein [Armatimonadaceae bacterium]